MAPSAIETVAVPAPPSATLKLYGDGSGDYKELAPSSYAKEAEEGKAGFDAAKVGTAYRPWLACDEAMPERQV